MANVNKRLDDLENRAGGQSLIVVNWNDGFVTVDGERISIDEFDRRYPDRKIIEWGDDENDK